MAPDHQKIQAVHDWPIPTGVTEVRQFLGPVSYNRRYIHRFADIAAPLHAPTQKCVSFAWTPECAEAFKPLKDHLVHAYPRFDSSASEFQFQFQMDASAVGLGAVLEQDGHVFAYASRSLTTPEQQHSVIQNECLAVVYALKQFHHYLLGR